MNASARLNIIMLLIVTWTQPGDGQDAPRQPVISAHLSEAEHGLVMRLREKDESALAEVLSQHQGRIYQLALKITGSVEDAEEITQDTFMKLLDTIDRFEGRSSLGTWVYKLGLNQALMRRRKLSRRQ